MTTIEPICVALNVGHSAHNLSLTPGSSTSRSSTAFSVCRRAHATALTGADVWLESFAIVFQEIHGFNAGELGLSFLGIFVGALVGVAFVLWWQRYRYEPAVKAAGGSVNDVAPEKRMELASASDRRQGSG